MSTETELSNLDSPPVNGLEGIFVLPEHLAADPRILGWYNQMVRQLRQEAAGLPMQSSQYTLMERIAYTYAYMRYQEFNNESMTSRDRQALQDSWQKMLDQFNRSLEKHNDKVVNEMLLKVKDIIDEGMQYIKSDEDKVAFRRYLATAFANVEM